MTLRVLVADDQGVVRAGFAAVIDAEEDMTVVGEAADGAAAVRLTGELAPDVVVMDIRMPELDGIAATRLITGRPDGPRVLVLTTFDLDAHVFDALRAGASGFLLKDVHAAELLRGIRIVAAGESVLAPSATRRLLRHYAGRPSSGIETGRVPAELNRLTARERSVLGLLASGLNNTEIAADLGITVGTVKSHVNAVLRKLALRDRVQATILAYDLGLARPHPPGTSL
ncbi:MULTISPECIES: response regulator [Streptomyces]|jgi:DNA-binding NarL/FixJ family response regulator|uniref:Two component transcriptional regulator, LuxR family n=1 Tax=Streptomyces griseoaurantiacus TaxID=68213 RepID=A0A1G7FG66_9ACTN|nr:MULTISPECIES: response regulator transcription factor [Streptomyces]MCF0091012.1 Transcriptional regulatory protein LiaR [Streptomyces sp. MH192]MCF0103739.1 Transcriptional regulatory protein LiaR [Streptomyces sp. MH191]MDX3364408.1 response regulator transcription factor [Streptomyces sp. ME02-6978.2a]NJP69474.1 response regulator transcription factor [Streptomyces sp. C1-2]SDE74848.1 two component transcriptional regulator, LuxR family [Streptomyces jietaisiensis]